MFWKLRKLQFNAVLHSAGRCVQIPIPPKQLHSKLWRKATAEVMDVLEAGAAIQSQYSLCGQMRSHALKDAMQIEIANSLQGRAG